MVSPDTNNIESLTPLESERFIAILCGTISGVGFSKRLEDGSLSMLSQTPLLETYLQNPIIEREIQDLWQKKEAHKYFDPQTKIVSYRKGIVLEDASVYSALIKEINSSDQLIQVNEITYEPEQVIELLGGLVDAVGFGVPNIKIDENGKKQPSVDVLATNEAMQRLLEDERFNEEMAMASVDKTNEIMDKNGKLIGFKRSYVSEEGKNYDIRARRTDGETMFYVINEVIEENDTLTKVVRSKYALKNKLSSMWESISNAREIEERREHEPEHSFTSIFIDMDGFKAINDIYGHTVGDKAIIKAANVLRASLRDEDFIARLGGDEIVILLDDKTPEQIKIIIDRINESVEKANKFDSDGNPVEIEDPLKIKFSYGVASNKDIEIQRFCTSSEKITPEMVVMMADQRMYLDKKTKKVIKELEKLDEGTLFEEIVFKLDKIFGIANDEATKLKREKQLQILSLLSNSGVFGEVRSPEQQSKWNLLYKAIFFQDLFTYEKEGRKRHFVGIDNPKLKDSELEEDEYRKNAQVNQLHPILAKDFILGLKNVPILNELGINIEELANIVEHQHSWVNGKKFPVEENQDNIPDLAKWLSIINAFVTITTNDIKIDNTLYILETSPEGQFDKDKVALFAKILNDYEDKNGNTSIFEEAKKTKEI